MLRNLRIALAAMIVAAAGSALVGAAAPAVAGEDFCLFSRPLLGGYKGNLP
jgi:hypothetical protein